MKKILESFGITIFQITQTGDKRLHPLITLIGNLFLGNFKKTGLMSSFEASRFFKPYNKGLLIDGKSKRLSEKESFNHMAVIARSGAGKTTSYIIPNIFTLAKQDLSMVITDLSGELHQKTSGYLRQRGFKVYVLDPENLDESIRYNPMYYATSAYAIDEMCDILIQSSNPKASASDNKVWFDGAKNLLSILVKALMGTRDPRYINLGNLRHLLNNFGLNGAGLIPFIQEYCDQKTQNEYRGFISGNSKTILSYVSTANTALAPIGINDNLEKLTKNNSFDFKKLRQEKSVIYIRIPAQKQNQYTFLLNLFYSQLFNTLMEKIPTDKELSIYALLDEFGNMSLPNFTTTITSIRKFRVSISIVLQDVSQLQKRYGKEEAESILSGGIASRIFFNGAELQITSMIEKMLGFDNDGKSIMKIREIRTMKDNEILYIYANKDPLKTKVRFYYEDFIFRSYAKLAAYSEAGKRFDDAIEHIVLPGFEDEDVYEEDLEDEYED